jgi:hypothetical protein
MLGVFERQLVPALERICVGGGSEFRLFLSVVARDRGWMALKPDNPSAGRPRLDLYARRGAPNRVPSTFWLRRQPALPYQPRSEANGSELAASNHTRVERERALGTHGQWDALTAG